MTDRLLDALEVAQWLGVPEEPGTGVDTVGRNAVRQVGPLRPVRAGRRRGVARAVQAAGAEHSVPIQPMTAAMGRPDEETCERSPDGLPAAYRRGASVPN